MRMGCKGGRRTHKVVGRLAVGLDAESEGDVLDVLVLRVVEDDVCLLREDGAGAVRHGEGELERRAGGEEDRLGQGAVLDAAVSGVAGAGGDWGRDGLRGHNSMR